MMDGRAQRESGTQTGFGASAHFSPVNCSRLVIKVGSSLLVNPSGRLRKRWLGSLIDEISSRRASGQQVILVSSGAIALGSPTLSIGKLGRKSLEDSQAAAAVGQIILCRTYLDLFARRGVTVAQILLTLDDLEDRRRYLNVVATMERLLSL